MKTTIKILIMTCLAFSALGCRTQSHIINLLKMQEMERPNPNFDRFDIDSFNYFKDDSNFWRSIVNNKKIDRSWSSNSKIYREYETQDDWYYTYYKEYYASGKLKCRGVLYNNSTFSIGLWEFFDENGKLIKSIDYDKEEKYMNYKTALEILYKECGFEPKDIDLNDEGDRWFAKYLEGNGVKSAEVDKKTGKVRRVSIDYEL